MHLVYSASLDGGVCGGDDNGGDGSGGDDDSSGGGNDSGGDDSGDGNDDDSTDDIGESEDSDDDFGDEVDDESPKEVNKSWKNLAKFIKKHNLTDAAGDDLIKLLGEKDSSDELPSSIYKLKKAFHLNVNVIKYCAVCYKEVTDICDNKEHAGICRHDFTI